MEENRAENQTPQRQHAQAKTHQAHKKKGGTAKKVIGTILAIGLTTCLMFFAIFMIYVHTSLDLDVDISAYTLKPTISKMAPKMPSLTSTFTRTLLKVATSRLE